MRAPPVNGSSITPIVNSTRTITAVSDITISLCAQLFRKLGLEPSPDLNRRVLAVLTLLRS